MKVWVTKYALTEGIQEMDADVTSTSPDMIQKRGEGFHQYFHGEGREWHRSRSAAAIRAETMRQAKIKSVQNQLARLQRLSFSDSQ